MIAGPHVIEETEIVTDVALAVAEAEETAVDAEIAVDATVAEMEEEEMTADDKQLS